MFGTIKETFFFVNLVFAGWSGCLLCLLLLTYRPFLSASDSKDVELNYAYALMVNEMASRCKNPEGKYMPILFNEKAHDLVPFGLRGTLCYTWPKHCKMIITVMKGKETFQLIQ